MIWLASERRDALSSVRALQEGIRTVGCHAPALSPDAIARHATGYHRRRSFSRLLLPLLMDTRTYLKPTQSGWQPFEPFYVNGAAYGGLVGTADGFTRYLQALLDPASGLITDASRRVLFTDNVLSGGERSGMALSWHLGDLDGHRYAAHAGGGGGFYAEIRVYPELQRGSVLLFNRSGFSDARFLDRVDRHMLARRVTP